MENQTELPTAPVEEPTLPPAVDEGPGDPQPKRKPLQDVYDYLLEKKVSVPASYADFEVWIQDEPRLRKLHERLRKDPDVDVNSDFDTFRAEILAGDGDADPEKKKAMAGPVGADSSTIAGTGSAAASGSKPFRQVTQDGDPIESADSPTAVDAGAVRPFGIPKLPEDRLRIIQAEEATLPPVKDGFKRVPLPMDEFLSDRMDTYMARNSLTGQRYIDLPLATKAEGEKEDQTLATAALRTFTNGLVDGVEGLARGMDSADRLIRGTKVGQAIDRFGEKVTNGLLNGDPNRGLPFDQAAEKIASVKKPIAEVYQQHDFLNKPSVKNLVLGTADLGAVVAATLPAAIFPESGAARLGASAMGLLFDGQIFKGAHDRAVAAGMTPEQAAAYTLIDSALELGTFRLGGKVLTGVADKVLPQLTRDAVKSEIMRETYKRLALRTDEKLTRETIAATIREATAAVTPRIAKIAQEAGKNSVLFGTAQAKQVLTEAAAKKMTGARFDDFSWSKLGHRVGEGVGSGLTIGTLTGGLGSLKKAGRAPEFESDATDEARAKRLYPGIVRFGDAEGGAGRVTAVSPDHQTVKYTTKDDAGKTIKGTIHADHVYPTPGDAPVADNEPRTQVVDANGRVLARSVEVVHHIDNGSGSSYYVVRLPDGKLKNVPAKQVQRVGGPATETVAGAAPEVLPTESQASGGAIKGVVVHDTGDTTVLADYNADGTPTRLYKEDGTDLDLATSLAEPESREQIHKAFNDQMAAPGEDSVAPVVEEKPAADEEKPAADTSDPLSKQPVFINQAGAQVYADYDVDGKPLRVYTDQKDYDLAAALGSATVHDKVVEGGRTAVAAVQQQQAAKAQPAQKPIPAAPAGKPEAKPVQTPSKPAATAPTPAARKADGQPIRPLRKEFAEGSEGDRPYGDANIQYNKELTDYLNSLSDGVITDSKGEEHIVRTTAGGVWITNKNGESFFKNGRFTSSGNLFQGDFDYKKDATQVAASKPATKRADLEAQIAAAEAAAKPAAPPRRSALEEKIAAAEAAAQTPAPKAEPAAPTSSATPANLAPLEGALKQARAKDGDKNLIQLTEKLLRDPSDPDTQVLVSQAIRNYQHTTDPRAKPLLDALEAALPSLPQQNAMSFLPSLPAPEAQAAPAKAATPKPTPSKPADDAPAGYTYHTYNRPNSQLPGDIEGQKPTFVTANTFTVPKPISAEKAKSLEVDPITEGSGLQGKSYHNSGGYPVRFGKVAEINGRSRIEVEKLDPDTGKVYQTDSMLLPDALAAVQDGNFTERQPENSSLRAKPAADPSIVDVTGQAPTPISDQNEFEQRRAVGSYSLDGNTYVRQQPLDERKGEVAYGKPASVEFATGRDVPVRYAVVDAETLQPSHTGGTLNRNSFISEDAQPKDRAKGGASNASIQRIANNPDLAKVSVSPSPYDGAPVINSRGEVIQGNGRGEGLRQHYAQGGTSYRQALDETAQNVGIDPTSYADMQRPVLVRVADVDDATAVELGNYKFEDKESGGVRRLDPKHVAGRLTPEQRERLGGILTPSSDKGETETLKAAIRRQQRALKQFFADTGAANETQLETLFSDKGAITPAGIEDIEALVQHLLLSDVPYLPQKFEGMRSAAKDGIHKALSSIVGLPDEVSILPQIRTAIAATRDYEKARKGTNLPFATWAQQGDLMNPAPATTLSPLELQLTEILATRLENDIAKYFNQYARAVRAESNPLFGGRDAMTREEAVKAVFNITDFTPVINGTNPGTAPAERTTRPAGSPANEVGGAQAPSPDGLLHNAPARGDQAGPRPQPGGTTGRVAGSPDAGPRPSGVDPVRIAAATERRNQALATLRAAAAAEGEPLTGTKAEQAKERTRRRQATSDASDASMRANMALLDAEAGREDMSVPQVGPNGERTTQSLNTTSSQKAGYVDSAKNATGGVVTIYKAKEQGIDTPDTYAIVCEEHGTMVTATNLKNSRASMKDSPSFCEGCREAQHAPSTAAAAPPKALRREIGRREGIEKMRDALGEKKMQQYFEQINRLFDPNQNNIVDYRSTGVVIKDGETYTLHMIAGLDTKTWFKSGTVDVTDQYEKPAPAPSQVAPLSVAPTPGTRPALLTATPELLPTVPERVPTGRYQIDEPQRLAVNLALDRIQQPEVGFLLADGTGVGKTRQILALADAVSKEGPVLVITANQGIIDNNFANDAKAMGLKPNGNVTMGTYTDLSSGKYVGKKYRLVIYDEGHNLKNSESGKATKARSLEATNAVYVTATPMDTPGGAVYFAAAVTNRPPAEIWDRLGLEYTETKNEETGETLVEVKLKDGTSPAAIVGNIAKLRDELYQQGAMIRREYPFFGEVTSSEIPLTDLQAAEQAAINDYWDAEIDENPSKRMNLAGQKSGDLSRWNEANKAKYAAQRIAEELAAGRKVVVLAEGVNDASIKGLEGETKKGFLNTLAEELEKKGIPFAKVYGSGNKGKEVAKFQGGAVDVLIGTSKSAGTGYDMDDSAGDKPRTLLMVTPPYGGDTFQQILGRVSRRNTKTPAKVEIIYTKADVDARRKEIVDGKLRVLKAIQDGTIADEVDTAAYDQAQNTQRQSAGQPIVGVEKISDRAFLVTGEGTKALKEDLKRMGARWFKDKASGKQGWMFPNYRQPDVEQFLRDKNALGPEPLAGEAPRQYTELEQIQQRRQTIVDQIKAGGTPENGVLYSSIIPIPVHLVPLYIDYAKSWIDEGVVRGRDILQAFRTSSVAAKFAQYSDDSLLELIAQARREAGFPEEAPEPAAATPPPTTPKTEKGGEVGGGRYKRRTVETIKENPSISQKLKDALDADEDISTYVRRANAVSAEEAQAIISLLGLDEAYEFAMAEKADLHLATYQMLRQEIVRQLDALGGKADAAGDHAAADEYVRRATAMFERLAKRNTEYGQATAATSELLKAEPDRVIYAVRKNLYEQTERAIRQAQPTIDAGVEAARTAQREAVDETVAAVGDKIEAAIVPKPAKAAPVAINKEPNVPKDWGKSNKIFTKAWVDTQLAKLKNLSFVVPSPIPPQAIILGLYHIEAGAREFKKFSTVMVSQLGKGIKPLLKEIYQRSRDAYVQQVGGTLADHKLDDDATVTAKLGEDLAERLAGRVVTGVRDRAAAAFDPEGEMLSTLMSKVRESIPEASSLVDGQSLTPTKRVPVPMKDRIAEAVRNANEYADLWEQSKDAVFTRIESLDLSDEQKQRLHDRLENFFHEVIGKPYSDKQVERAVSTELGNMGPNGTRARIESIIRQGLTEVKFTREALVKRLVTDAGLAPAGAEQLAKSVEAEFNRRVDAKRQQMKDAILNPVKRLVVRGNRTFADKLAHLIKLGAFDDADVATAYADYLNLPRLTAAHIADLRALVAKVEAAPEGWQKDRAMTDLLAYQAKIQGVRLGEIMQAMWYGNVLSSYLTQSFNVATNAVKTTAELGEATLHQMLLAPTSPSLWTRPAKGLLRAMGPAWRESMSILKTGYEPNRDLGKYEAPNILEIIDFANTHKLLTPLNTIKYVTRMMKAGDVFFSGSLAEMRAEELAILEATKQNKDAPTAEIREKVNEMLFNTSEKIEDAKDQAYAEGFDEGTTDFKRRVWEIMQQQRDVKLREESREYGIRSTFNGEMEGTLGAIISGLTAGIDKVNFGGVRPLRFVFPFTKVPTNIINEMLYYTPVGFTRAARKGVGLGGEAFGRFHRAFTPHEQQRALLKATLGTATFVALYALSHAGKKDEKPVLEITGGGTGNVEHDRELREQGWQPYSIRVGDNHWIPYGSLPGAVVLAAIGHINDQEKYSKEAEIEQQKLIAVTLFKTLQFAEETSPLRGPADFLGALNSRNPDQIGSYLSRLAGGTARGFQPLSGLTSQAYKDYGEIFNIPKKEVDSVWGNIVQDVPFARNSQNDAVNALGEPVMYDTDRFLSTAHHRPDAESEKIWKYMDDHNAFFSKPARNTVQIFSLQTLKQRPLTDDEYYEFIKLRGQSIKEQMQLNMPIWDALPPEDFQKEITKVCEAASSAAETTIYLRGN